MSNNFHCQLPPAPPSSRPPVPCSTDDYADGYWSVQHPPPPTMGSFRRPPSSDDDLIMVVGTSASLGGQYAHRPRRFRQPRSASHLDSASSVPLYDEVSAQTTTSTLSPQSRRTDKSCGGRSSIAKNMNYNLSTNGVPRYNYESLHKQNMITSNSSSGSSASQPLRTRRSSLRRHSKSGGMSKLADVFSCGSKSHKSNDNFYRRVAFVFGVIILLLALVLGYLFYQFKNIESKYVVYDESGSVYYNHNLAESQRIPYMEVGEDGHRLLALPESFRLGEFVHADLPPGQIVYTKFSVQHDSPIQFNISVGPKARIALYARQTLRPSLTAYDYTHIIRGDHLHVAGAVRRLRRSVNSFKSTVVTFELLSGKWNLGIFNDGTTPQAIGFVASTVKKEQPVTTSVAAKSKKTCKYHCFSKGVCKEGKCHCHPGYSGDYCEETACPVLCSGNGIFTNGRCNCHDGFKGPDCDIDARWCAVPNCNHHGQCDSNGRCICDRGWTGEFCELRDCDDPTCSNNGICQNATCYCGVGWYGKHCEQRISTACTPLDVYHEAPINQADFYKQDPFTTSQPVVKSQPTDFKVQNDLPIFNEPVAPVKKTFDQSRCNNRGEFDSSSSKCNCFDGWTGKTCELQKCASECVHGICSDGQCLCDPQYTGADCSQKQCLPGCEKHGVCNNGVCECNPGWNGENCFIEGCPNNCSNTGTCQQFKGAWQCACDSSHYGPHCEYAMETSCDDGIDNDDDGLVDCEDSECCSHSACSDKNPLCTKVVQPRSVLLRIQAPTDASFFQRNHFLIEPESVQRFADVSLFNESRAAIIRGEVVSSKGGPLTSVRVSDTANPRFGFSLTRGEGDTGAFDIMVNGGGFVTLQFLRQPFGKVEKSFYVPANDIINVGKIYMNEVSSPEFNKESIAAECQEHHLKHVYAPKIMPSWILRQYAGGFNDNNEDITRVVADARVVLDSIPIAGTNEMEMIYSSDRADGFQSTLHIALLPADISPSLRLVHVKIQLAGQEFKSLLVAKPKLVHTFHWNHLNVYSQTVYGLNLASVSIGYEYEDCSADSEIVWHHEQIKIEGRKAPKNALGLWSLNFHHHFDPLNNVLQRGDGLTQYLGELSMISRTLVGSEKQREAVCSESCLKQSIDSANLFLPTSLAIASDGTLYIGDFNVIRRVKPDRSSIDVVLELSSADISSAYYLAVDPSTDKLYISIPQRRQIWMLKKTDRIDDITTNYKIVIGDGATCTDMDGSCGDGGPAESAQLNFPKDITFGNSGNMFILDGRRIRYVTKDRVINTLVGVPVKKSTDNCATIFRMNELALEWPLSIVFEPTSSDLIVLDADVIYRLNTRTGVVKTLAGSVKGCTNQDLSHLDGAQALSIDPKLGVIYIAETDSKKHNFVRSLPVNGGRLTTVAGIASKCDCDRVNCPCDDPLGKPPAIATQSFLHKPVSLIVDAHGRLYVADQANFKIKLVEHVSATFESSNRTYVINSPSTNEVFHFNQHGLHQMTTSLLSGQELYHFKYSVDTRFGMLSEVTAPGGFSMRLSRMNETDIILDGTMPHKTLVRMHTFDRQLVQMVQILTTDGKTVEFDYENGQLLKTRRSLDRTFFFEYDAAGRVTTMSTSTGETYSFDSDYSLNNVLNTDVHLNGQRFRRFIASNDDFSEEGSSSKLFTSLPNSFIYENEEAKSTFDAVTHPLLRPHESAILKRKIVLPSTEEPMRREIRSRFEWRTAVHTDEGKNVIQVGRRPRINGRNAFTIEFDRQLARDIVRDAYDNDILTIVYTPSGLIAKVEVLGALNLEPFSGTYDSHGLPLSYTWGELRQDFAYDAFQRLIANTFSRKGDLLVRRYTYGSDSSPNPSMVTMPSGNMFKWLYNSDGGVASLKSPSDEVIDFWGVRGIQNDAAAIYYRRSKAGHFNGVATATYNSKGVLMEFVNLNGNERVSVKRDVYGRIVRIQSGKYNTNIEYDKYGRVSKASTNSIKREYFYQGPLVVAMKRTSDKGGSAVYFSTEYDDLFRQTTIHINFNGTALEPLKLEYDHLTGHISKIGRCIFTSSNGVQRISNDAFVYDSEYSTTRQLKKVTLIVGGLTVIQFQSAYDTVGRLESTIWTVQDETRPTVTHAYAIDGGLSEYALSSRANKQIWHSYYDASGRLVKINDDIIEIGVGGIARRVGQLNYTTDNNGWTLRRGVFLFDYDALGQLRRATHTRSRGIDLVYEYDEKNRIIARRYLHSGRVQRFYYALANANELVTHFTDSSIVDSVWTIHYNNEKTPYLLECSSGTSHIIVTDPTGSVRFVVNEQGSIDRELGYSPTGDAVFDTKMDLYFPLGYLGKFHDVETGIVFVTSHINGIPVTRPMDSKLGRYMSTSLNMVFNEMNAFRPEEITDPFMFEHHHKAVEIPATPNEWLLLAGTNVKNLIPFTKLDLDSENTCVKSAVVSGAICAAEDQLRFLSQVMTMQPTKFMGLTSSHLSSSLIHNPVRVGINDNSLGSAGLSINYDKDNNVHLLISNYIDIPVSNVLSKVFSNTSFVLQTFVMPEPRLNNTGYFEIHLVKVGAANNAEDDLHVKLDTKLFNITLKKSQLVEIASEGTIIFVHYQGTPTKIRKTAINRIVTSMEQRVWSAERAALKRSTVTVHRWNDKQRQELLSSGRVRGFVPRPSNPENLDIVSKASTNSIKREYIYQGPLVVAIKRTSDKGGSAVYFSTEYDDLFRQTTIHINFNGTALEPLKLEYDHLTGHISKIGRSIFTSSNGVQRISNDAFVYDSEYSTTRRLKKVTLSVGGLTVIQFQSAYDTVGRLESTIWTVQDETRPTVTHAYAIDGGLSEYALSSRANKQIWHSYYDASGRLVKINDDTIEIGVGGIARRVGQLNYTTDNNGWTLRRGVFLFDYDALGQLRRATHTRSRGIDIVYEYDEKNRIIARRYLHSGRVQRFYYALANANELVTHFTDSSIVDSVWTIYYNNEKTPYLLECSSGTSHIIVTDSTGSVRFIVNEQGSIDRELGYSPTGDAVFDTKMNLYFPLGYLGKFHDVETGIVFVTSHINGIPVTRPMDSKLGRYMSTSLNMVFNEMNAFRPEEITDPFMFEHNHKAVEIPATPNEWLLLAGTNVKNLISFTKLDLNSENTCIKSAVVSGAICAAEDQLRFLSQVMTMQPTKFMGLTSSHLSSSLIHNPVRVGINDNSLGSAGLSINYDKDNNVHLLISNYIDIPVSNVLSKVFSNTSFVLQTFVMPEPRLNNTGYFEIHLVKVGAANNAEDDLHVKLDTKLFNITLKKSQLVEIASEGTIIFVHYQGTPTKIRKTAIIRIVTSMEQRVWSAERAAFKRSTVTVHRWNDKQRQELLSSGRVRGFVPRPSNPENLDIVQNIEEWKFKPI